MTTQERKELQDLLAETKRLRDRCRVYNGPRLLILEKDVARLERQLEAV